MRRVISSEKIPIKFWLDYLEDGAEQQAKNLANLPFAFKHIAIMPDAHSGYGMPIGGVLASKGYVIPNAVGVDIGCGMCAVKTSIRTSEWNKELLRHQFKEAMGMIREQIPVGFNHQAEKQDETLMPPINEFDVNNIVLNEYNSAMQQIGTLGGGNHFIEIQKDNTPESFIWIMVHSGSRNLGKKVADYYNKIAIELNGQWQSIVPKSVQLAFLPMDSPEGHQYLKEMQYCVDFALANRKLMMERIKDIFKIGFNVSFGEMINIAHNYAKMEHHFGENVLVHRKGAVSARKDEIGIIPGSQGTCSYIVRGLGNPESFMSSSHGAGRVMSRSKAKSTLKLEDEIKLMNDKNIIHGIRNTDDLDEAPSAYKNIEEVMEFQSELVEIVTKLTPLAVVKG